MKAEPIAVGSAFRFGSSSRLRLVIDILLQRIDAVSHATADSYAGNWAAGMCLRPELPLTHA